MQAGKIRRITPEEVRAAEKKTGLCIDSGITLWLTRNCGCPMGVVAYSMDPAKFDGVQGIDVIDVARVIGLDGDYAEGFANGFDGDGGFDSDTPDGPLSAIGRSDGVACRKAFVEGVES